MTGVDRQLYMGDCVEWMQLVPEGSVDLVVTDPPYLLKSTQGGGAFGSKGREYHDAVSDMADGLPEEALEGMCRVLKKVNMYIFCSKDQVFPLIAWFRQRYGEKVTYDILTWHKTNPTPSCNNKYLSDTEYILFFREKGVRVYGSYSTKHKYWVTPVNKADKSRYGHPTVKPLEIVNDLVINSSQPGDTVMDPFMGTGTTGVAALMNGRRFIGMETEERWFNTAVRRTGEAEERRSVTKQARL